MKSVSSVTQKGHTLVQVRAGFVAQGTSLHAWCKQNGIDTQNARKALTGQWTGPKASLLCARLVAASDGKAA